ncbi:tRNA 4-thiouridine(8) synthase ThiI [Fructilactobacillus lindneri]|uniref:Probable tRNA sulfurtransferase n=2 Tax=Fructilactobacillus lindneri TaxID=53444 RepID=A0A0R2JPY2_9LACO|nr:tRNA uracil 4-sulfurtransferase ThiI [Fructilactobacillus lindneri]ANZ58352.1 tRNA sulfurtransferase ThiI [Fructilactobacillus lindneri]ANZ59674.1 tRNA sulfurtransferase ThiI [Fructilactobacillus lindneri]KRN79187.1 thiamine biosynthesis protein thiI [Fructilactobacillus lindneri DSM 20690 = JCM 11027]POG98543.1 tRNA 4-thiouridine(8) synthase ThiI [Fructilactobacillus lindneri]POH03931.1 tRNA 4-thiouridine(8) synthase ThiI [Fructilactobacillus lindneri]
MKYNEIMVRYGELSTKGKNRRDFIRQLGKNIRNVLVGFDGIEVKAQRDRLHVILNGQDAQPILDALSKVFGIETFSPVVKLSKDASLKEIQEAALQMISEQYQSGNTFKISTNRQNKNYPLNTYGIDDGVGSYILDKIDGIDVEMKRPDINLRIDVRLTGIYLSSKTISGSLGLPVGTGGRATMMLSGGIDSPVAAYMAMKRGVKIDMIHFYSPPYTSEQALAKAKDLTAKLTAFSGTLDFIQVPFTKIQEEIKEKVPEGYLMTIQRRMMLRLAVAITIERHCNGVFTGESLGQVASQTLESMRAINDVTTMPVLRPLLSLDKTEIIKIARDIDTYDLSIMPFEDCCTIFTPPSPKTKPDLEKTRKYEKNIDIEGLMQEALDGIKISKINVDDNYLNSQEDVFAELL